MTIPRYQAPMQKFQESTMQIARVFQETRTGLIEDQEIGKEF